jgi:hypothetical protein
MKLNYIARANVLTHAAGFKRQTKNNETKQ